MEFVRTIVEQMEDAAALIICPEVRQVRIGFILVDNVAELRLKKRAVSLAEEAKWGLDPEAKRRMQEAAKAVQRHFRDMVSEVRKGHPELNRHLGVVSACHRIRNELYHWGLLRAEILRPLARVFFHSGVELIEKLPLGGVSERPGDDTTWVARYAVRDSLDPLHSGLGRIAAGLHSKVPSATPDLASALGDQLSIRVSEVLDGLDYLVENANGHSGAEDAMKHVQFFRELENESFPEVVAARGTRGIFKAMDDAKASFQPKVKLQHLQGWKNRAEEMMREGDELKLVAKWDEVERNLVPIEELVSHAVFELDMHFDSMLD